MAAPSLGLPPALATLAAVLALSFGSAAANAQSPPPNIVFLFADDLGWTDISSGQTNLGNGSDYYRTPNIDRLASQGMAFDNAYSNGPNCAPTRAALMSGQCAARTGIYTVGSSNRGQAQFRQLDGAPNKTTLDTGVVTLAETLKSAGYATGHFGKWHLGDDPSLGPTAQGFDVNAAGTVKGSVSGGSSGHFAQTDGSWNLPNLPANGKSKQFMAERLTDEALAWMTASSQQPFFCYLTHFSVHTPIQAPSPDVAAFNGVPKGTYHKNQTYAGMLKNLDDQVGRVVTWLESTADPRRPGHKLIENTVVVYYSDNGGLGGYATAGIQGGSEITHQFPLKSGKGSLYEGGIRIPLIVRWDGVAAPKTTQSTPITSVDFYPTLAAIAGATLPKGQVLDGVDFGPLLTGQATGLSRPSVYWHFPAYLQASSSLGTWRTTPGSIIRRGDWKLHFYYETRTWHLYDLAADIGENNDVAAGNTAVVRSLGTELRSWLVQTKALLPLVKGTSKEVPLPDPPGGGGGGDHVDWRLRPTATTPPATARHVVASSGGGVLAFGGDTPAGPSASLWSFDGNDWSQVNTPVSPPARRRHAGCQDRSRGRLVVFGGEAPAGALLGDTWEYDGSTWAQVITGSAPAARRDHAVAFDAARNRVVLFGGRDANGTLGDTWEFDGAAWSQRTPPTSPPARFEHRLVHDPVRDHTWLFGGVDATGAVLSDTWSWDGTAWTQLTPSVPPPARAAFAVTWDAVRGRAVVWGGRDATGATLDDTWELAPGGWVQRTPAISPSPADGAAMAFDDGLGRTVLFGGHDGSGLLATTWDYQATTVAATSAFGQGCPGTGGTPALAATTRPWLGGHFEVELTGLPVIPTNAFVVLGVSNTVWAGGSLPFSLGTIGAPGCDLLVDPLVAPQVIGIAGRATFGVSIPNLGALVGGHLFEQALVFDPLANPLRLVASQGLDARLGAL